MKTSLFLICGLFSTIPLLAQRDVLIEVQHRRAPWDIDSLFLSDQSDIEIDYYADDMMVFYFVTLDDDSNDLYTIDKAVLTRYGWDDQLLAKETVQNVRPSARSFRVGPRDGALPNHKVGKAVLTLHWRNRETDRQLESTYTFRQKKK